MSVLCSDYRPLTNHFQKLDFLRHGSALLHTVSQRLIQAGWGIEPMRITRNYAGPAVCGDIVGYFVVAPQWGLFLTLCEDDMGALGSRRPDRLIAMIQCRQSQPYSPYARKARTGFTHLGLIVGNNRYEADLSERALTAACLRAIQEHPARRIAPSPHETQEPESGGRAVRKLEAESGEKNVPIGWTR